MSVLDLIAGHEKITAVFGGWPAFHDAEVLKIALDREGPTLMVELYVFAVTSETDPRGYFKRTHESAVVFQFDQVRDLELDGFNHQNVLSAMTFEPGESLSVALQGIHGVTASFTCQAASVRSLRSLPA